MARLAAIFNGEQPAIFDGERPAARCPRYRLPYEIVSRHQGVGRRERNVEHRLDGLQEQHNFDFVHPEECIRRKRKSDWSKAGRRYGWANSLSAKTPDRG